MGEETRNMKKKIIYIAPNDKVFTYTTTSEIKYIDNILEFYDEVNKEVIILPLDRCQVREVQ